VQVVHGVHAAYVHLYIHSWERPSLETLVPVFFVFLFLTSSLCRWFMGYMLCDACGRLFGKDKFCPICLRVSKISERIRPLGTQVFTRKEKKKKKGRKKKEKKALLALGKASW